MSPLTRRQLLVAGALTVVASGTPLLTGCDSRKPQSSVESNRRVALPDHRPYKTAAPDLPGTEAGVMPGYLRYPISSEPLREPPGDGSAVSVVIVSYTPPPPPVQNNRFWQELNKKLGIDLRLTVVNGADYSSKLATIFAGGDLPDLLQIYGPVPDLPRVVDKFCQELTSHLSGSAAADFPYLSNIPQIHWRNTVLNGGIYGVPSPRSKMGGLLFVHQDVLDQMGLDSDLTDFNDFKALCAELTDARHNRWALTAPPITFVQQMLGIPNQWREDDGKLIHAIEVEEAAEALEATRKLVEAGYVHPDSVGQTNVLFKQWFNARSGLMHYDSYVAWGQFALAAADVAGEVGRVSALIPPKYDAGSTPHTWQGPANLSITVLKKADDKRIRMLLEVLDYLAAPVGTPEKQFLTFGVEGVDHVVRNGELVLTKRGNTEIGGTIGTGMNLPYIVSAPAYLYEPGHPEVTKDEHAFQQRFIPISIPNPVDGLYSDTESRKGAQLNTILTNVQNDILAGRRPVSDWADAVRSWKSNGGDMIRREYENQLQAGR